LVLICVVAVAATCIALFRGRTSLQRERLVGEEQVFYDYAVKAGKDMAGGSLEAMLLRRIGVKRITLVALGYPGKTCGEEPFVTSTSFEAVVVGYTAHGFPYTAFKISCTGAARLPLFEWW
jgi:hypothetical protein